MPCVPLIDAGCLSRITDDLTAGGSSLVLGGIADGVRTALTWVLTEFVPLWTKIGSPDLAGNSAVAAISHWLLPITAAVAVCGMLAAAARMMLTRRARPLLDIGTGLVTIAAVSALGVVLPDMLLSAGDSFSQWVLTESTGGNFRAMIGVLLDFSTAPDVMIILLGLASIPMLVIQIILLIFRTTSIVILAGLLPLAAAGSIAPLTRSWIRKLLSWMLALICYKPAAAMVYAAGFAMIGSGNGLMSMLAGMAMIALSLVALPVLMRFFTWTTGSVSSGGGSGQFLGMAAAGAAAMGAFGASRRSSAADHAAYVTSNNTRNPNDGSQSGGLGPSGSTDAGTSSAASGAPGTSTAHGTTDRAAPGSGAVGTPGAVNDGNSPAGAQPGTPPAGTGDASAGSPGGSSGLRTNGKQGQTGKPSGGAAAAAGASMAALMAAQGLAQGARDAAANAMDEGERRDQ
jgi:hypothetical protein